jgi:hypothetical protein
VKESPLDASVCLRTIDGAMILPQSSHKRQLLAISAAISTESSLLAYATGQFVMATFLGAISSAVLSWSSATSKIDDPRLAHHVAVRTVLALALIFVTTITLLSHLARPHLFHGIAGSSSRTVSPGDREQRTKESAQPESAHNRQLSADARDAYSGILLWPKKRTHTKLIAPPPMSWNQKFVSSQHSNPLVIPFEGVYWFFREPDLQPPAKSQQAEGSPEMFNIDSTDWRPLSMEAHQNLGTLVGLDCCGKIQVAIRNADGYPKSISLEVILVDTTAPGKPFQSLGRAQIVSSRKGKSDDRQQPANETLNFLIPANSAIHRFDEVTVLFRLDGFRARAAAKIGIDHFTLIPRGFITAE